jgi:hypothetical protein
MTELVRFELANGGSVVAELDESPSASRAGRPGVLVTAKGTLDSALTEVRDAAAAALTQFQEMTQKPDEVEVKFGVKLDVHAGAVIARTGMQGHIEVTLKWKQES